MKKEQLIKLIHVAGYALALTFIIIGFFVARKGQDAFMEYLKEDGLVENLTALFLISTSGVAVFRCFRIPAEYKTLRLITWITLAVLFFFATGEEISWGQRIFNWKTSEFFDSNNAQHETNLHNLVVGGVKINKLVFSQLMGIVLGFYFILLRPLAMKSRFINRLVNNFSVPLPRWNHVIALVVSLILCSQYHLMKAAELRELAFSIIMFLVFLYPAAASFKGEVKS